MPRQSTNKSVDNNEQLKTQANNIFSQSSALTETVKMPSRGKIKGVPEEIVIKAVQRKDKKKALMSETDNILLSMLQACIVSPKDFNVYNLLPFESEYLLYRLKVLTYGGDYIFKEKCPYCDHMNEINMNLSDIPIIEVPDNFKTVFDIPPLPISGMQFKCRLLTEGELISLSKQSKELEVNTGNKTGNIDLIWDARVVSINGNAKLAPIEIEQILDDLVDYDSEYLMTYYNKYVGNYGLQTKLSYICDNCKSKIESDMPSIYTFFRPAIKIPDII